MMNPNAMHKITVGIGLAAAFGLGVSVFAVRAGHESQIARNALAATLDQNASDATASAQSDAAQMPTDPMASNSSMPPPVPFEVAPTPASPTIGNVAKDIAGTPASDQSKPARSKASDRANRRAAKTGSSGATTGTVVAPAPNATASPADGSGSGAVSDVPAATDSQITALVKSEIAAAAPTGNVDVSTTNGNVALAGSVPSQEAADQVRLLAQRVAGVKQVDVSGVAVGNQ